MEPEKEEALLADDDHAEGRGVTFSNLPAGSILGNGLKQNLEEATNMEDLKIFLRKFKEEAKRWLGFLELGYGNEKMGSGGLEDGGQGNKAHGEHFKSKGPIPSDKRDGELTCVYSRRSPRKMTTQWQQVSRPSLAPVPQTDRGVQTEKTGLSPGDEKDRCAPRVLEAGSCSRGSLEMCFETEHVSRQPLAPVFQPDREAQVEKEVLADGKVGIVEEQVAGLSSPNGQESCTVTGSEWAAERKEEDFIEEIEMEEPGCEVVKSAGLVAENGVAGLLNQGKGEDMSRVVVEKNIGELGINGVVIEEPEGEKDSGPDPVFQLEPSQRLELESGGRKGVGWVGGEESAHACNSREPEGLKEMPSDVIQSGFNSEIVKGGGGEDVEGFGPISVIPLAMEMDKDSNLNVSPRWVLERVKGYYKLVGVSCDQVEDKLLALFEEIEAIRTQSLADSWAMVTTVSGVKGQREIKRLDCSINYDKKGEQSNRRRGKGRGVTCVNEA